MKARIKKHVAFAGKSLLWSLLLYVVMMLAFNWDEITTTATGSNKVTVVDNIVPSENITATFSPSVTVANNPGRARMVVGVMTFLKAVTGLHGVPR